MVRSGIVSGIHTGNSVILTDNIIKGRQMYYDKEVGVWIEVIPAQKAPRVKSNIKTKRTKSVHVPPRIARQRFR